MKGLDKKLKALLFTRSEQQAFLEDVCALIKDGVPAPQAVNTIYEISHSTTKEVAKSVLQSISEGQRLADGMEGWFSTSTIEIVRAGEEGGALTATLDAAAAYLAKQSSSLSSVLGSVLYPIAVLIMGMIVAVFLKHSVFVNFAEIKPEATWPQVGKTLIALATLIQNWWWLFAILIIAVVIFVARMLVDFTGELRQTIDSIPPLSLYRDYSAGRFMQVLGMLLRNGIGFKRALSIMQNNANRYLSWHIAMMQYRLSAGQENIADVLDTGMVREEDIARLRAMAKGRGFETALSHLGEQALTRNYKNISTTGRILGVFLLFCGAAFAIFMVFAIYNVGTFVGT